MSDENEDMLKSSESVDGSESSPVSPHGKKRKSRESDDITSSTTSGADRGSGGGVGPYPPEPSDETKAKIWETLENDYRDTSHISELEVNARAVSLKRQQAFPAKLHGILSSDKFINSIVWLPHGRAWKVVDQKVFKNEVLPSFFNHCSTSSFMRQVNNWNFTRILSGPDEGAYYHQYFLRGLPHICLLMKSKSHSKSSPAGTKNRGPDILARMLNQVCPDFYVISERHPLPPAAQSTSNPTSATSSLATSTDMGYTSTSKSDDKNVPQPHPQHSPKQTDSNNIKPPSKNESPLKQHTSSSDESHSFSSSTIPPKSSSSFSTEDEKNGNSGKSRHSHDHSNQATTISGSSATKSSEAQLTHNNIQAQNQAQQPCAPQVMIEGRMINFDGSGITIPSAGILFGGYSMNQYLAQNQHILSRSIFFHPAISSGANAGVMPQRFNPAVAYPFDLTSVPALQGGAVAGGGIATNQQPQPPSSNNNGEKKSSSELNSSSDNSF